MNEQQLILQKFNSLCLRFADKKIAIYGVGINTKYIIENMNNPNSIIGLVDAQKAGQQMYGYHVYSADEIAGLSEIIIIIARVALVRMIYERIKYLENSGLKIYNLDGDDLHDCFSNKASEFEKNPYWNCSELQLKDAIDRHKTITFDLFDTLLMRRVLRPCDVFDLVERSFEENFGRKISFSNSRLEAEREINAVCVPPPPNYDQIYVKLSEKLNLPENETVWLKEKEMDWEKKLLVPRNSMVDIFRYAVQKGKTVLIVSDMYFSSSFLSELLANSGMPCKETDIFVSNEYNATKESGQLFKVLKQKYSDILHIGDNKTADIEKAEAEGIDTYYVMSASDLLLNSPLYPLISQVKNIEDSLTVGRFAANVLNNPFALNNGRGKVTINSLETIAEYFIPIALEFLRWLVQTIENAGRTVVCFMSRDGYLMNELYNTFKKRVKDLPGSFYFLASRDALSVRFAEYHDNYRQYARNLGLHDYHRILFYDLATKGTCIAKIMELFEFGNRAELVCFNTFNIAATFPCPEKIHSWLGDFTFYHLPYTFLKVYELFEILSQPDQTQFLYFDNELQPVFADKQLENQKQYKKIAYIQGCIIKSLTEALSNDELWHLRDPDIKTADAVLTMLKTEFSQASDEIKDIFVHESHYEGIGQTKWFDRAVN